MTQAHRVVVYDGRRVFGEFGALRLMVHIVDGVTASSVGLAISWLCQVVLIFICP